MESRQSFIHRVGVVSQKSSTSYFAEYFRAGLTDSKNFNGYISEIICEHKCVINVLIVNVPKCCHLAN